MGKINYVQFHIGDFLTGVLHMDAVEVGAYTMLIMAHYQAGENGLPDDDKKLARIAKVTTKKWAAIKGVVLEKFTLKNGMWCQKRVVNELKRVKDVSTRQRDKALKKHNSGNATAEPRDSQPITNNQEPIRSTSKGVFTEEELSQFRQQCPSLSDSEFNNEVSNCEIWINTHGSKTPELTLSRWLQKAEKEKPKTNKDGLDKIKEAMQ